MKKYVLRVTARNAFGGTIVRHWTIPEALEASETDQGFMPVPATATEDFPGHVRVWTMPVIPDYYAEIVSIQIAEHTLEDAPPQGYSERVETIREGFRAFLRHEMTLDELKEMMASE